MNRGRATAVVALGVAAVAGMAPARAAPPSSRSLAATQACLERLPGAVVGLPPATPPVRPAIFVYETRPARLVRSMVGQLGAWRGRAGSYEGATLSFFRSARAARAFVKASFGGTLAGTVVVQWDRSSKPWRGVVRGCLASAGGSRPPRRPAPPASLATFSGAWGGHTRRLRITSSGRGIESANDGCCVRVYDLTFRILSVRGTVLRAAASYRVTSFTHYPGGPRLHAGQVGRLLLRNGIVTDVLTRDFFCSEPAWAATGACGA